MEIILNKIPVNRWLVICTWSCLAWSGVAHGQLFPSEKPITIVVGFVAGGGTDTSTRIIAQQLSENLGQSVIVENRAGAGGTIATQYVAHAKPDGTTLLLGTIGPMAVAPHLVKLSYDPENDFAPITMAVNFPNVLVVSPELNVKSFEEFIALAKKEPGKLTYGSTGVGSAAHLAGELLNQRAGIEVVHVPYKGGSAAMIDLLGGRISAYYSTPSSAEVHILSKKLIALATTGLARTQALPDLPTVAESGYPGFNATNWYAFVAPAKTPDAILERWNTEIVRAIQMPAVWTALEQHGLTPDPTTRQALANFMHSESITWGKVVKERHITMQ